MADLLQTGSDWLQSQRIAHMSQEVVYKRGSDQVSVNATFGKTDYEVTDESGFKVAAFTNDFLITVTDLILAGQATIPKAGDQIIVTKNGQLVFYEVLPLPNAGCFRFSDPFDKTLRIHTKRIGV